jgi:hypothetical protein
LKYDEAIAKCGTSVVHLLEDENINDALSKYQEEKVQNMMQQYGALIYNEDLQRNDPPDGHYLCNTECLEQLNKLVALEQRSSINVNENAYRKILLFS